MGYDSAETRFERKLRDELSKQIKEQKDTVAQGMLADFALYRDRCGFIRGLQQALVIADSVAKTLNRD